MARISCRLRLQHVPEHLYQVLAGFVILHRRGILDLRVAGPGRGGALPPNMLEAVVEGRTLYYDLNDGYDNFLPEGQAWEAYYDQLLSRCDLVFKRSYSTGSNRRLAHAAKMRPLGLNYMVTVPWSPAHDPRWSATGKERLAKLARLLPFYRLANGRYTVDSFEDVPRREPSPRVLFLARLWDEDEPGLPAAKRAERAAINEVRAQCVRLCREAFGERFFGGLLDTPFARERCPELVMTDGRATRRAHFLQAIKRAGICVTTTGLHDSIGWKLAEYVAASKAIVTEPLRYQVPGDFGEGRNYAVFETPAACVDRVQRLIDDPEALYAMMTANYRYYQRHVRPDQLVLNSLLVALEAAPAERPAA